jgi:hypothetical protein
MLERTVKIGREDRLPILGDIGSDRGVALLRPVVLDLVVEHPGAGRGSAPSVGARGMTVTLSVRRGSSVGPV